MPEVVGAGVRELNSSSLNTRPKSIIHRPLRQAYQTLVALALILMDEVNRNGPTKS